MDNNKIKFTLTLFLYVFVLQLAAQPTKTDIEFAPIKEGIKLFLEGYPFPLKDQGRGFLTMTIYDLKGQFNVDSLNEVTYQLNSFKATVGWSYRVQLIRDSPPSFYFLESEYPVLVYCGMERIIAFDKKQLGKTMRKIKRKIGFNESWSRLSAGWSGWQLIYEDQKFTIIKDDKEMTPTPY